MTFTKTLTQWTVIAATVVGVGMAAAPAEAAALKWTLQGVTFNDGGTATGSFSFDADTNTLSEVDISTFLSNGDLLANYVSGAGNANGFLSAITTPFPTFKALFVSFSSPLTNLGGEVALQQAPAEIAFANNSLLFRSISSGSISANAGATPIPTPALLPGLVGLGVSVARKRKQGETSKELEESKA
jgi:hypothetical protein